MVRSRLRMGCTQSLNLQWMDFLGHTYHVRDQYAHFTCQSSVDIDFLSIRSGLFAAALAQAFFARRVYALSQRQHGLIRMVTLCLITALSIVSMLGATTAGVLVRTILIAHPLSYLSKRLPRLTFL